MCPWQGCVVSRVVHRGTGVVCASLDSYVVELVAPRGMAMLRTWSTVALPVLSAHGQTLDIDVTFEPVTFLAGLCRDTESNMGIRTSESILCTFQSARRPYRGIGRHALNIYMYNHSCSGFFTD